MTQSWMDERVRLKGDSNFRARYRSFRDSWNKCQKCRLGKTADKHCLVRGELSCDILFIGEGPGRMEDMAGVPFIGPAGRLLSEWLFDLRERFPKLRIALTNLVCCRPFDGGRNRQPDQHEIQCCSARLNQFLALAHPKAICLLGRLSQSYRLDIGLGWSQVEPSDQAGFLELYHPAYHLRNGRTSELAEQDRAKLFEFCVANFDLLKGEQT